MAAEKNILVGLMDGLHCISLETGVELWHFTDPAGNLGGKTPAVDQAQGFIYFQTDFRLHKINARNGQRLDFTITPGILGLRAFSGNTVLVNDTNGYHILTYWYRWMKNGSVIQCYDANLDLEWEVTGLNATIKTGITYHDGLVYIGTGETYAQGQQEWYVGELENCRVIAYNIADGTVAWEKVLSDPVNKIFEPLGYSVMNTVYCNGYLICDMDSGTETCPGKVQILNALTGDIVKTYNNTAWSSSCAGVSFSYGRLVTGDLNSKKVLVYQIGTGAKTDFAPFGVQQTNTMEAPDTALASLDENITKIAEITGGDQGSCIVNGIAYVAYGTNNQGIVSFDIETLATVRQYATGNSYDASPLVVAAQSGDLYILIHEDQNGRVICRKVSDGSLVWYAEDIPGNAIFGLTYYESAFTSMRDGMTSTEYITALNDNFTSLNALVGDTASLVTITSLLIGQDLLDAINGNIDALNSEIVTPVSWVDIELGETGLSAITKLNDFNIAFKLVA